MALFRFTITGAIPLPETDAEKEWLADLRVRLRVLKSHCVIINESEPNEEDITNFSYHLCHHDVGFEQPCEPEQEF